MRAGETEEAFQDVTGKSISFQGRNKEPFRREPRGTKQGAHLWVEIGSSSIEVLEKDGLLGALWVEGIRDGSEFL